MVPPYSEPRVKRRSTLLAFRAAILRHVQVLVQTLTLIGWKSQPWGPNSASHQNRAYSRIWKNAAKTWSTAAFKICGYRLVEPILTVCIENVFLGFIVAFLKRGYSHHFL